jgi:NADH-quinone oxidoreductase subunit F
VLDAYAPLRAQADASWAAWQHPERPRIDLAWDTSALAAGAERTRAALETAVAERGAAVELATVHGYGLQWLQPLATISWPDGTRVLYGPLTPDRVEILLDEATGRVGAASELAIGVLAGRRPGIPRIEDHPYLACEGERRLLARIGRSDPEQLDHYLATGGYHALARMLDRHHGAEAVRGLQQDAQLLGKGGAFFPAGVKWNFLAGAADAERYLVCNADEGDPGAWVNRVLLEGDPHLILEGMLIAAYATGASHGFVYIRGEYPLAIARVRQAIADAAAAGLLGERILGSAFSCTLEVVAGAGAYVCGEETGLIASIEDDRGMPRIKPPFPAQAGVFSKPTNVNNVETYASATLILEHGAEWYRAAGTERNAGTKIFSFSGDVARAGFMELPYGVPLSGVLAALGGATTRSGAPGALKAIQPGGPLAGYLPARLLDELVLEKEAFAQHGALIGAGGIVFVGEDASSLELNVMFAEFLEDESCGRCTTCHHGNQRMTEVLQRVLAGGGRPEDRHNLELLGEALQYSNCVHGSASPTIMRNTLRYFADEFDGYVAAADPRLAGRGFVRFRVVDHDDPRLAAAQAICPVEAIRGSAAGGYTLDEAACLRCGACHELAPRGIAREDLALRARARAIT